MTNERPIKVCHLGKYYPPAPGGMETHVRTLARTQAELGTDVQVVCVNHADQQGRDVTWRRHGTTQTVRELDGKVEIIRLGRLAHVAKLDLVPGVIRFFRNFKHDPVDIIHVHTPNPTMLLAAAALRPRAPMVITHHSDVVKQRLLYRVFSPFEHAVYSRAARIISNSAGYVGGSTLLQRHADRVEVVPMGLDLSSFLNPSPAVLQHAAELREKHGPVLWLSVGRLVYYKGYDTALHALTKVPGNLLIVGQGPYFQGLKDLAQKLGVSNRLIWLSHCTDEMLAGAYLAAHALWFPSNARSEAFGLVQVEAMAAGCPVINTQIPHSGVSWVSPHEQTGLTVPVGDADAFATAANRLLADRPLREQLSSAGHRRAIELFSQVAMAASTLELYYRVLGRPHDYKSPGPALPPRSAGSGQLETSLQA